VHHVLKVRPSALIQYPRLSFHWYSFVPINLKLKSMTDQCPFNFTEICCSVTTPAPYETALGWPATQAVEGSSCGVREPGAIPNTGLLEAGYEGDFCQFLTSEVS
jgi:hypothetical protein